MIGFGDILITMVLDGLITGIIIDGIVMVGIHLIIGMDGVMSTDIIHGIKLMVFTVEDKIHLT